MEIEPQVTTQPISDDQELAKVLAGVNQDIDETLSIEEPTPTVEEPEEEIESEESLEDVKKDALFELRPLLDKLDLVPEEKFDIYLLLLRSSDDKTLIVPAHNAARNIEDETRRAQALLDIIKEIDYLQNQAMA